MRHHLLLGCFLVSVLTAATVPVAAHHTGKAHLSATVTITQPVLAGGKPLSPGTYDLYIYDERPTVHNAIPPSDAQRTVEFAQKGTVVATEIAEMFPAAERPVGTSGSTRPSAKVQTLKGGEFVRVAVTDDEARYLIHLPTGAASVR